ncbi:MAG TPA: peptide chain release factor N(5)-glutamine methyltransferase [Candidatus Nanoarchaeia archaeon]|nr:peptide chain release factor N(5)-glutamine methyltransferase [Candidatus Nanoarchaeia archaeon]
MTIRKILDLARKKFAQAGLSGANWEAEILLSAVLGENKEYLLAHPEKKISFWQYFLIKRMINQRLAGYSSAMLTGHKWFYGLDFIVDENVLIPRPETELMVEEALKIITNYKIQITNVIDIGTGSGCIIISLAKKILNTAIKFYGVDISRAALRIAQKNSRRHGLENRIHFLYSDLLNNIDKNIFNFPLLIAANLPYLAKKQIKDSPSIQKEPEIALLSGNDGLDHYRRLFDQVNELSGLAENHSVILAEIDESQNAAMGNLIRKYLPGAKFELKKDLAGHDRLVIIKL